MKEAFLSLPEEETFKYFDIFKKTLSGSLGKNLMDMEFPLAQEAQGGTQEFLLRLRNSKLQDDDLVEEFYDRVIESFGFQENYYIVLIHAMYDIPGKTSDGFMMEDASDEVYEFILCSLCPVGLSAPGLSYNSEKNSIEDRMRDWVVGMPVSGFLFPAFLDRSTDIHHVLYYAKKAKEIYPELIDAVLGAKIPMTAEMQKEAFHTLIAETLGDSCEYEVVKEIHEQLHEAIEEHAEDAEPLELSKGDIQKMFEKSGVSSACMESFENAYNEVVEKNVSLLAENLTDTKKMEVALPDVVIKVKPERADLVETRVIDGRKYFVIAADGSVEVNGLDVKVKK